MERGLEVCHHGHGQLVSLTDIPHVEGPLHDELIGGEPLHLVLAASPVLQLGKGAFQLGGVQARTR